MARRVYFAFHYQSDITRVNVVRNSWLTHEDREAAGFYDASLWEKAKKTSDDAIRRLINDGLNGTTVTAFLLGSHTAQRPWVRYELEKSYERGNGMLAVRIHQIKNFQGQTSSAGSNIFDEFHVMNSNGTKTLLSLLYPIYDWIDNSGYQNLGEWVEKAAKNAGG